MLYGGNSFKGSNPFLSALSPLQTLKQLGFVAGFFLSRPTFDAEDRVFCQPSFPSSSLRFTKWFTKRSTGQGCLSILEVQHQRFTSGLHSG